MEFAEKVLMRFLRIIRGIAGMTIFWKKVVWFRPVRDRAYIVRVRIVIVMMILLL